MNTFNTRLFASASFAVIASVALAGAAQAQTVTPTEADQCAKLPTPAEQAACVAAQTKDSAGAEESGDPATMEPGEVAEQAAETDQAIVVTGSRLRSSPFTSPDPLSVINPELEERAGKTDTADILTSNPAAQGSFQLSSTLTAGGFVTNGGLGAQTLSLRGLGAERTLVLVNGRRAGPAGVRGSIAGFDLNVLPSSLLRSVEIVKTGTSSIYGSDAIAGTVNLLTKRDTDGLLLGFDISQPFQSGGETYKANASWGKDFGRGHFLIGLDYYKRKELKRLDRNYLDCPEEYVFDPTYTVRRDILDPRTGEPRCTDSIANLLQVTNFGAPAASVISTVIQYNNPGDNLDQYIPAFTIPTTGTGASFRGPAGFYWVNFGVNPAATPPRPLETSQASIGLINGYLPLQREMTVLPELDRRTIWFDGSFELTDNIEIIGEGIYNRRQTDSMGVRQLFFQQFTGNSTLVNLARCPANTLNNCVVGDAGDPYNSEFAGNVTLQPVVLIPVKYAADIEYIRGVVGARGGFGGDGLISKLRWDSWLQYSRSDGDYTNSRVYLDAIEKQQLRSRTCAGQLTRIRQIPCLDVDFTDPRVLRGEFTPEESAFLFGEETGNTLYTQVVAEASIAGEIFTLPAGDLGAAIGVQWRRDEIDDTPGDIALSKNPDYDPSVDKTNTTLCNVPRKVCDEFISNVQGQSVSGRTAGFQRTSEAFGEVQIPLFHNTPFVERFDISAAARLTNVYAERYDGVSAKSKNNWTYKVGFNWQTNEWLRFRGSIGTSYRSPALFEQFLAPTTSFPQQTIAIDPCINWQQRLIDGFINQTVADRCAALGIAPDYSGLPSSSALGITGGGIGVLEPETSLAKTLSVVVTPAFAPIPGMRWSFAIDYFDIKVKDEITQLGSGNIVYECFESDTYPNDPLCALFDRAPQDNDRFPQIIEIRDSYINIATQRNRGVDVTARIRQDLGGWGNLNLLGQMTFQIEDTSRLFADSSKSTGEGEIGEPQFVGDFKLTWDKGPWQVFYGLNVVGSISEEQDWRNANAGALCVASTTRPPIYCPITTLEPIFYHAASVTRKFGDRITITAGISNLFDTKPPRVSGILTNSTPLRRDYGNTPTFGTQYDLLGRRGFVNLRVKAF